MTPAMIDYIRATQLNPSDEKLQLLTAAITGSMFYIGHRPARFAVGVEHRKYEAAFNPDTLRQLLIASREAEFRGQSRLCDARSRISNILASLSRNEQAVSFGRRRRFPLRTSVCTETTSARVSSPVRLIQHVPVVRPPYPA